MTGPRRTPLNHAQYSSITMRKPIGIVHCAPFMGIGHGVDRMNSYYGKFLNRSIFDPVFVVMDERYPSVEPFDPDVEYIFTGKDNKFEKLVRIFGSADIVHFQGGYDPISCEAAKVAGVPVLVEILHTVEKGLNYPEIDKVICVSETTARLQDDPSRTQIIYNGVDLDEYRFNCNPRDSDKIVIIQVSNRYKIHINADELAADILAIDSRIEIWLAGGGQDLPSTDRVKFLGLRKDIPELFNQADINILLSKKEAFGLVVAEAMACGLVPIVYDIDGPGEIVTDGHDGFKVSPFDRSAAVAAVAAAIKARDTSKWEDMRRAARRTAEDKFDIRKKIIEYEKVYLDLCQLKGRRVMPGPSEIPSPNPDAIMAEWLYKFDEDRWEQLQDDVRNMALNPLPVRLEMSKEIAARLGGMAAASGRVELARTLFGKLYDSGFRDVEWMKLWLTIAPKDPRIHEVIEELLKITPGDVDAIFLSTEKHLEDGHAMKAMATLERGMESNPASAELAEVYELLKARVGR